MPYLNTLTNEYPRYQGDLELLGWEEGQPLPENWVVVAEMPTPTTTYTQCFFELPPKEVNGVYIQQFDVRDLTPEELEAKGPEYTEEELTEENTPFA